MCYLVQDVACCHLVYNVFLRVCRIDVFLGCYADERWYSPLAVLFVFPMAPRAVGGSLHVLLGPQVAGFGVLLCFPKFPCAVGGFAQLS